MPEEHYLLAWKGRQMATQSTYYSQGDEEVHRTRKTWHAARMRTIE